jgi:hypothetical protein
VVVAAVIDEPLPPIDRAIDDLLFEAHVRVHDYVHALGQDRGHDALLARFVWGVLLAALNLWVTFYADDAEPPERPN